jgi:phosphatidylglycerophosphate synthase
MFPFLSKQQLTAIATWKYTVVDTTITGKYLYPILDKYLHMIPETISPNLLTMTGLLLGLSILSLAEKMYHPVLVPLFMIVYYLMAIIDSLDGKQARRINNSTAFGEVFDHSVDMVTLFVITRISSIIFRIEDVDVLPIYTLFGLIFIWAHYRACIDGYVTLATYSGPNEMLVLITLGYLITPFFDWKIIFASETTYWSSIFIIALVDLYFVIMVDISSHPINDDMLMVINFLLAVLIANLYMVFSHVQLACIFIMINAELIIAKMSKSNFRECFFVACLWCCIHEKIALFIMLSSMLTTFIDIKNHLQIPFLAVFTPKK